EIDTVIGKNHKQAWVTIVERKSKFSLMRKGENKTAELVATATIELLRPDKDRVLTLTADRGKEFDCHEKVAKALECDTILLLRTPVGSLD
ncbi:MAG: IS30 family transposase, partial [Candidatus Poribacteria bacterium]